MKENENNRIILYVNDKNKASIEALEGEIQRERGFKVSRSQIVKEILIKYLMERENKCVS
jgi:hypothetical protein